ncbi:MAG: sigma-54 dependent transcriptional regulator [Verrucomicrobiota bacterium]
MVKVNQTARHILVVDDDSGVRGVLRDILSDKGHTVLAVGSLLQAEESLLNDSFDLVLCDLQMQDGNGLEFLEKTRQKYPDLYLIVITGFGTLDSAVEAIRIGVFDYLTKPINHTRLDLALDRLDAFTRLERENESLRQELVESRLEDVVWGESHVMQQLRSLTLKIGPTDTTVLIQGESGVGKEVISRALCASSPRSDKPFIKVNCAAVPANLLETEFFGHERGAFTGADKQRLGRFELAHTGTLMLDEITEIPPELQVKLLRVLQEQEFERVGGTKSIKVDVRILATTNRDLKEEVRDRRFREDLYYRLNVVPIEIPPLRQRGEDVLLLAGYFLSRFCLKHGKRILGFSEAAKKRILDHSWPGNVRELQNTMERSVILAPDKKALKGTDLSLSQSVDEDEGDLDFEQVMTLEELEYFMVRKALEKYRGNRTYAAKKLGISLRTIRNKLAHYREEGKSLDDVGKETFD